MAKGNGRAAAALPQEFIDQVCADFRAELEAAGPELLEGMKGSGKSQASFSATVSIKRHPGTKRRSEYTEATLEGRVRAPREPRYYDVDFDGQGRLTFDGVLDGPPEPGAAEEAPAAH